MLFQLRQSMWFYYWVILSTYQFCSFLTQPTVDPKHRVDCAPRPGDSKDDCIGRGCIWDSSLEGNINYNNTIPFCYFPTNTGYTVKSETSSQLLLEKYSQGAKNPYGEDFKELELTYKQIGSALKVSISRGKRYIPPVPLNENIPIESVDKLVFKYTKSQIFCFTVERSSAEGQTTAKIWNTSIGGLLFADQYIQIATYLPSDLIYGFGENIHQELKHNFNQYLTWGMFSRDEPPNSKDPTNYNYYGVHPFYLGLEPDGKAHGVFIFNSNAQEISTGPGPHLIYRTIGGQLDVFFFPGPRPEQVLQQYHQLIGRPTLPAYWSLGFQLCRYGYKGVEDLKQTVQRQVDAGIPIDVAYADIDYMEKKKDFTFGAQNWSDFPVLAEKFHQDGMHLILIFDPAIQVDYEVFKRGLENKASFIQWPREDLVPKNIQDLYPLAKNTKVMLGRVWPERHVAFPDFLDLTDKTNQWWANEFMEFHKKLPFDGIWIDMNEPSNFFTNSNNISDSLESLRCPLTGPDSYLDNPPYATASVYRRGEKFLSEKTLCLLGQVSNGQLTHYDTHSLYGWSETVATSKAMMQVTGKRGAVISRSTFPGSGKHGGHWLGDNTARWEDLKTTVIGVQEFNFFGIPYVGSDVCGFLGTSNEELCLRWQQLGAFHSFYRNHNDLTAPNQDPAQWKSVAKATREANLFRYQHLPYLYSLHYHASLFGGSVIRPVFFEFPADSQTHSLSHQFLWGASVMVVPVLSPNVDSVIGYLPPAAEWYSMSNAHKYGSVVGSGYSTFSAPRDTSLPCFVRAGSIIPKQRPDITTTATRTHEFQLLIALTPSNLSANGELYWDDGESIVQDFAHHNYLHFTYTANITNQSTQLVIHCDHGYSVQHKVTLPTLDVIEIFGYPFPPNFDSAKLNGQPLAISTQTSAYFPTKKLLMIDTFCLIDLNKDGPIWTIIWENKANKLRLSDL